MTVILLFPFIVALVSMNFLVVSSISTNTSKECGMTYVNTEHLTYDWTIRNFSLLPQENGELILSPIFRNQNNDVQWKLQLNPKGKDSSATGYTSIYLYLHSQKEKVIKTKVHFTLSILKSNIVHVSQTMDYTYLGYTGYGWAKFASRSHLLNVSSSDDTFIIRAEIDMPAQVVAESFNITEPLEQELSRELEEGRWNELIAQLLKNPKLTDVIVVVSNETFFAHKTILATRSPVFAAMFETEEWREKGTSAVHIENMEPIVGKAMLESFYTDDVTNLETLASGLLEAADRFQLPRLRTLCEMALYRTLNEDNAADMLVLTDLYHAARLKEHIMKFIVNHLSAVMKTKGYGRMEKEHPRLLIEVLRAAVKP